MCPYDHHGPPFSSDEPLTPEGHLYDMATTRPSDEKGVFYEQVTGVKGGLYLFP